MTSLSLLRLRIRVSLDQLLMLAVMVLAVVLIIGFQVLRLLGRSGDDGSRGGA